MNASLWSDIADDIAAAERHFGSAGLIVAEGAFRGRDFAAYKDQAALMHAMQMGHTSAESALRRIVLATDGQLPTSPEWHSDLLKLAVRPIPGDRPAIISEELEEALQETRGFRHIAMHVYDKFRPKRAVAAVAAGQVVARLLRTEFEAFRAALA